MADPTMNNVGRGMTVFVEDSKVNQNDVITPFLTQNFCILASKSGTNIHICISDATPSGDTNYNNHPIGSLCVDTATGNWYRKTAAGDNWTVVG